MVESSNIYRMLVQSFCAMEVGGRAEFIRLAQVALDWMFNEVAICRKIVIGVISMCKETLYTPAVQVSDALQHSDGRSTPCYSACTVQTTAIH